MGEGRMGFFLIGAGGGERERGVGKGVLVMLLAECDQDKFSSSSTATEGSAWVVREGNGLKKGGMNKVNARLQKNTEPRGNLLV